MTIQHCGNHGAMSTVPLINNLLGLCNDLIGGASLMWRYHHQVCASKQCLHAEYQLSTDCMVVTQRSNMVLRKHEQHSCWPGVSIHTLQSSASRQTRLPRMNSSSRTGECAGTAVMQLHRGGSAPAVRYYCVVAAAAQSSTFAPMQIHHVTRGPAGC